MKYVAYERQKAKFLIKVEDASYIPAGWRKPYYYSTLAHLSNDLLHPSEKRPASVSLPGLNTYANNVRIVDDETTNEIDDIDRQINELKIKRQKLIYDRFLTFRLVEEDDLKRGFEPVFTTKAEAEKAFKEKKVGKA